MDYSERYQPIPMQEIQSENFAKDADMSMEIRIVTFQGKYFVRRVVSYSHLSDEKSQIAATTFQNTFQMLDDLIERADLNNDDYAMIIFITDGCAGQYKCGTALYLMAMHAQRTGRMFYHLSNALVTGSAAVMRRVVVTKHSVTQHLTDFNGARTRKSQKLLGTIT